jgi:hypothetical protein
MNTTHTMKRTIAGVLLSGRVAMAGLALGAGTAQAYPTCTPNGTCSTQWCPGKPLPAPDVKWDMSVCHDFMRTSHPVAGATQVGANVWEGNPCGPVSLFCTPRRVPS